MEPRHLPASPRAAPIFLDSRAKATAARKNRSGLPGRPRAALCTKPKSLQGLSLEAVVRVTTGGSHLDTERLLGAIVNIKTENSNGRFRNFVSDAYFSVVFFTNCVFG